MENGLYVVIVFLDLKRAFETIEREIMIEILKSIGVRDVELSWFESYLTTRKQQTKYKNKVSTENEVPIGLPQGSTLGVVLFNLYINSITKVPQNGSVVLFADDTALINKHTSLDTAITNANEDCAKISDWLKLNKLILNTKKTKI